MRLTPRHAALHDAFRYTFAAVLALIAALAIVYGSLLFVASKNPIPTQEIGEYSEADKMEILAGLRGDTEISNEEKIEALRELSVTNSSELTAEEKMEVLRSLK